MSYGGDDNYGVSAEEYPSQLCYHADRVFSPRGANRVVAAVAKVMTAMAYASNHLLIGLDLH